MSRHKPLKCRVWARWIWISKRRELSVLLLECLNAQASVQHLLSECRFTCDWEVDLKSCVSQQLYSPALSVLLQAPQDTQAQHVVEWGSAGAAWSSWCCKKKYVRQWKLCTIPVFANMQIKTRSASSDCPWGKTLPNWAGNREVLHNLSVMRHGGANGCQLVYCCPAVARACA